MQVIDADLPMPRSFPRSPVSIVICSAARRLSLKSVRTPRPFHPPSTFLLSSFHSVTSPIRLTERRSCYEHNSVPAIQAVVPIRAGVTRVTSLVLAPNHVRPGRAKKSSYGRLIASWTRESEGGSVFGIKLGWWCCQS